MNRKDFEAHIVAKAIQDEGFRKALKENPREILSKALGQVREGAQIPESVEVVILEESANKIYLVIPHAPQGAGNLSDEQLAGVAGGAGSQPPTQVQVAVSTIDVGPTILDNGVAVMFNPGGGGPQAFLMVM